MQVTFPYPAHLPELEQPPRENTKLRREKWIFINHRNSINTKASALITTPISDKCENYLQLYRLNFVPYNEVLLIVRRLPSHRAWLYCQRMEDRIVSPILAARLRL
jgi:hypothetical protein